MEKTVRMLLSSWKGRRLLTSPVLEYPDFEADFLLETDASIQGLGSIPPQPKLDGT